MSFYRQIKNAINNNDYFRNRRNESENIHDLEEEELNINDIDNNDKDINNNFVHNNIIGENNIGKFREKINNREQIIEQNYKNLNDYQNNNRYNDNIYEIKKQYRKIPIIKHQDNNYINSGKRMYKSESTDNALRNNYYLSQIDINKNNNNYNNINNITNYYIDYTTKTLGKRRTDITDNNFIQIYTNKRNFVDYYNKKVEIQNENKKITEEKNTKKKNNMFESRLKEQKEIKMENNYFNSLATQNLLGEKKSKIIYKNFLDEQVKNNISDKLMNENLSYNDIIQNKNYSYKKDYMTERNFLNKNNFVEVNPYNRRNYSLGNSFLSNDVITNPQITFKHNKYIFPENQQFY